ncbi:universal stress protein [Microlunatus parietis]|uniref:Nucleotide-binding universal stress UspA family protein n=1 Tax=Microlunatus parietis TaxID=682979 RepID=A0A7Y9LE39_9ACTN|nr:universal stress protein [Microlunatus parietis]NYE74552.1 nucleotide-binding universal stress UspA family protein [Microlunatus parietis]
MESTRTPCEPEVVVGFDDSPSARAALRWASRYARSAGLRLRAVHVLGQVPDPMAWVSSYDAAGYLGESPTPEDLEARIKDVVRQSFQALKPEPAWRLDFVGGSPGKTLINESRHSQLLVIGTREHTGIERLISGSVSHYCLSHSLRPIVAVPAPDDDERS